MLNIWSEKSGYSFGVFDENTAISESLPILPYQIASYKVISGQLPPGLIIQNDRIEGIPAEVGDITDFIFCIRATSGNQTSDRTFTMTITGADPTVIDTNSGLLQIGYHGQYYALEDTYVEFKIAAHDNDTAAGRTLTYFISSNDGVLPDGLSLSLDGVISGKVTPLTKLYNDQVGYEKSRYENNLYDSDALIEDPIIVELIYDTKGFESYVYDSLLTKTPFIDPSKIRGYDSFAFDGPLFDTEIIPVTAPNKRGVIKGYEALAYDTDFYDTSFEDLEAIELSRVYDFIVTVSDGFSSIKRQFTIFAVGNEFLNADNNQYTIDSTNFTIDATHIIPPKWVTPAQLGLFRTGNYIAVVMAVYSPASTIFSIDSISNLPSGMQFDPVTGSIFGYVPEQIARHRDYIFTITATVYDDLGHHESSSRTFSMTLINELATKITWITNNNLDTLPANIISNVALKAVSSHQGAQLIYELIDGTLPSGLELDPDGNIVGTPYITNTTPSQFTIRASDLNGTADRTFTMSIDISDTLSYSNIKVKPLLKIEQRKLWSDFINDPTIFTPSSLYRVGDENYGIQDELSMLIYAGIQRDTASMFVSSMNHNHKNKRFQFGNISYSTAVSPGTRNGLYEVIYLQMIDSAEINGKSASLEKSINDNVYYPSSVNNWEQRIKTTHNSTLITNGNYIPLWMQSIDLTNSTDVGLRLVIPLCFCKVGKAAGIISNIKRSNFDFKQIDYYIDRYIIDAVTGYPNDKYLEFNNDRMTI